MIPTRKLAAAGCLLLALALALAGLSAGYEVYSQGIRHFALYISAGFSYIYSFLPLAVSELCIVLALPCALGALVYQVRRLGGGKGLRRAAAQIFCALCALALVFSLNLGVHYGAPPLSGQIGLYVGRYSPLQLAELTDALLEKANEYAALVPRNSASECEFGGFQTLALSAVEAYQSLSGAAGPYDFSAFSTPRTAPPKPSGFMGVTMSRLGIAGYYFPWTAEAIVSTDTLDFTLPFTIAHEAAHGHGVAAEDEANFAAYLACVHSSDVRLNYSAYFNAYIYTSNALYAENYELWLENAQRRGELLSLDIAALTEHLQKYQTPVRDLGEAVNNAYIVATGQPDGVKTYGMVVDLLLAWHFGGDSSNSQK